MTHEKMREMLSKDEKITIEYKECVNQLNNPNKMSPTLYLSIEEFEYEGMLLLYTYVPPTSTVEKCSGRVYDRNEEGDMDITDSPIQMENLYARKSNTYTESKLCSGRTFENGFNGESSETNFK